MFKKNLLCAMVAVITFLPFNPVAAQDAVSLSDVAKVEILPGWRKQNGIHLAGLRISLAEGWKTYWRAPGDAGIPPQFDWTGSENLTSVDLHWPTPTVFVLNGIQTIAYKGQVVIPIELKTDQNPAGAIKLNGRMDFGVCEDVCVPISVQIAAELANAGGPDDAIQNALNDQPTPAKSAGVGAVTCIASPISDGMRLTAKIDVAPLGGKEAAVVELADRTIWISEAETERTAGNLTATAEMVPPNGQPFGLARSDIRITVFGENGAIDIQGCSAG